MNESIQFEATHPYKTVIDSFGEEARIDEEIAELLQAIWNQDIDTLNSCQANPDENWVWIEFNTELDARKFLELVNQHYKNDDQSKDIYRRSVQHIWGDDKAWVFDAFPHNQDGDPNEYESDEIQGNEFRIPDVHFHISIRFPKSDYAYVLNKIKNADSDD